MPPRGFYEYRARAYDPTLGRFMSEDPKGFDAGDYNLYRYCDNDPMDLSDPMGLEAVSNGDGTFHFELRSEIVLSQLSGAYVVREANWKPYQCLAAVQVLAGTHTKTGLHDAPRSGDLRRGEAVSAKTPNGAMIATGFRADGSYPNESKLTAEEKASGAKLNHTIIKSDFDSATGTLKGYGQNASTSKAIKEETHDTNRESWFVVISRKQHDDEPSKGVIRPAPVVPEKAQ